MSKEQIDQATRHKVMVQSYAEWQAKDASKYVDNVIAAATAVISLHDIPALSKTQLERLYRDLNKVVLDGYQEMQVAQVAQLDLFGESEYQFSLAMLEANATVALAAEKIRESFIDTLMAVKPGIQMSIGEALESYGRSKAREIVRAVSDGHIAGLTSQAVSANVAQLAPMQKTQAGSLVRTMVNAVSVQARQDVFAQNADILEGYQWLSTLDSRTTLICASRDGKVYPIGSKIKPPAHWGCRSDMIAKIKPEYDAIPEGVRPSVGAEGAEQVSSATTYGQWLKRQPAAFQDEVLGPQRAALFRRGGLSIDAFTTRQGRVYTLDELRRKQPLAFAKANI